MGKSEMMAGYKTFLEQLTDVEAAYPSLKKSIVNELYFLKGRLDIVDNNGKNWDNYDVEIHYQEGFPYRFPALFETGGKIPRIGDWHIYEDTLTCCVKVEPEEILRCKKGITLIEYIADEALPYLFNQSHRRIEGYYVNGEYSHGVNGFLEFYSEQLKTCDDIRKTVAMILYIADNPRPYRTNSCFCGSGKKFRHCHKGAFDKLKELGEDRLRSHAHLIGKAAGFFLELD